MDWPWAAHTMQPSDSAGGGYSLPDYNFFVNSNAAAAAAAAAAGESNGGAPLLVPPAGGTAFGLRGGAGAGGRWSKPRSATSHARPSPLPMPSPSPSPLAPSPLLVPELSPSQALALGSLVPEPLAASLPLSSALTTAGGRSAQWQPQPQPQFLKSRRGTGGGPSSGAVAAAPVEAAKLPVLLLATGTRLELGDSVAVAVPPLGSLAAAAAASAAGALLMRPPPQAHRPQQQRPLRRPEPGRPSSPTVELTVSMEPGLMGPSAGAPGSAGGDQAGGGVDWGRSGLHTVTSPGGLVVVGGDALAARVKPPGRRAPPTAAGREVGRARS